VPVHVSQNNALTVAGARAGSCRAEGSSGSAASGCRTPRRATGVFKMLNFRSAAGPAGWLAGDFPNRGAPALWVFEQVLTVWQLIVTCLAAKPASRDHWSPSSTQAALGRLTPTKV